MLRCPSIHNANIQAFPYPSLPLTLTSSSYLLSLSIIPKLWLSRSNPTPATHSHESTPWLIDPSLGWSLPSYPSSNSRLLPFTCRTWATTTFYWPASSSSSSPPNIVPNEPATENTTNCLWSAPPGSWEQLLPLPLGHPSAVVRTDEYLSGGSLHKSYKSRPPFSCTSGLSFPTSTFTSITHEPRSC